MNELSLEKFNPTKAELTNLSERYKSLSINGIEDEAGYLAVDQARKDLKKTRVAIEKKGKELRSEAIAFQKGVIAYEKELVEMIEPLEIELSEKQKTIDQEKSKLEMVKLLPVRQKMLEEIEVTLSDEEVNSLDVDAFSEFYNQKKFEYLERKDVERKKEQEEKDRIEREKKIAEDAKLEAEARAEEARKQAEAKAEQDKKDAEAKAEKEKLDAIRKVEAEKQAIIDEAKRKEQERLDKEAREKKEAEDKAKRDAEAKAKLEAQEKYQTFLKDNKYDENIHILQDKGDRVLMFKKVAEFIK